VTFKDILLPVRSYPDPTPSAAIELALDFAGLWSGALSVLSLELEMPRAVNVLANLVLDLPGMAETERRKSAANARRAIEAVDAAARARGVTWRKIVEVCTSSRQPAVAAEWARTHDVALIPLGRGAGLQQYIAEQVIFDSGRPVIVYPETGEAVRAVALGMVGIAWDGSRPAARAVADAMPILQRAKTVRVVTITGDKTIDAGRAGGELARHLGRHGIDVVVEQEEAAGRPIGRALDNYAAAHRLDLLVMGAYGHSRVRDFVLGGATETIVAGPSLPVFLSH